ncbi:unnamed protein product [Discosporangium mesarthrocarpum]
MDVSPKDPPRVKRPASSTVQGEGSADASLKKFKVLWQSGIRAREATSEAAGGAGRVGAGEEGLLSRAEVFKVSYGEAIEGNVIPSPDNKPTTPGSSTRTGGRVGVESGKETAGILNQGPAAQLAASMTINSPEACKARARARGEEYLQEQPKNPEGAQWKPSASSQSVGLKGSSSVANENKVMATTASGRPQDGIACLVDPKPSPPSPVPGKSLSLQPMPAPPLGPGPEASNNQGEAQVLDRQGDTPATSPAAGLVTEEAQGKGKGNGPSMRIGKQDLGRGLGTITVPGINGSPSQASTYRLQPLLEEGGKSLGPLPSSCPPIAEARSPQPKDGGVEECKGFPPPNLPLSPPPVAGGVAPAGTAAVAEMKATGPMSAIVIPSPSLTPCSTSGMASSSTLAPHNPNPAQPAAAGLPAPHEHQVAPHTTSSSGSWGASFGIPMRLSTRSSGPRGGVQSPSSPPLNPWYLAGAPDFARNKPLPPRSSAPPQPPLSQGIRTGPPPWPSVVAGKDIGLRPGAGVGVGLSDGASLFSALSRSSPPLSESNIEKVYERLLSPDKCPLSTGKAGVMSGDGSDGRAKGGHIEGLKGNVALTHSEDDAGGSGEGRGMDGGAEGGGHTVEVPGPGGGKVDDLTRGILEMMEKERRATEEFGKKLTKALLEP